VTPAPYRKRPVVIEAMQLTDENAKDVCDWIHGASRGMTPVGYLADGTVTIQTLEGTMTAPVGWWIIRGVADEFYPCHPDVFAATYEKEPE
jgi:hypothetical protein